MGLPEGVSINLVLGRLFKLHPNFDDVLAGILISSPEHSMVVLISEKIYDWNQFIYDRIYNRVVDLLNSTFSIDNNVAMTSNDPTTIGLYLDNSEISHLQLFAQAKLVVKKLRFMNYDFYGDLLRLATVILDTFPYGGTIFFCYMIS